MYSVVLMVALSGGTEVPDCHFGGGWGGCWGGYGCWGGCYGGCGYGYGCWGGCYGSWGGCYGCYGYGGYAYGGYSNYAVSYAQTSPAPTNSRDGVARRDPGSLERARVLVHLPADARLTVNGELTHLADADRSFVSPPLARGAAYAYTLQAQITRDGRTLTASRTITVRPGKQTEVSIAFPDAGVARR